MKFVKNSKGYGSLEYTLIIGLIIIIAIILLMWVRNKALMPSWLDKAQGAVGDFIGTGPGGPVGEDGGSESGDVEDLGDEFLVAKFYEEFEDFTIMHPEGEEFNDFKGKPGTAQENIQKSFDNMLNYLYESLDKFNDEDEFIKVGDEIVYNEASGLPLNNFISFSVYYISEVKDDSENSYVFCDVYEGHPYCMQNGEPIEKEESIKGYSIEIKSIDSKREIEIDGKTFFENEVKIRFFDIDNPNIKSKIHTFKLSTLTKQEFNPLCSIAHILNIPEEAKGENMRFIAVNKHDFVAIGEDKKLYKDNTDSLSIIEKTKNKEIIAIGESFFSIYGENNYYHLLFASKKNLYRVVSNRFSNIIDHSEKIDLELDVDEEIVEIFNNFIVTNKYIYSYGNDLFGYLGHGSIISNNFVGNPTKIKGVDGENLSISVKKIVTSSSSYYGYGNSIILTTNGDLFISGSLENTEGKFKKIESSISFIDVEIKGDSVYGLSNDNKLYYWDKSDPIPKEVNSSLRPGEKFVELISTQNQGLFALTNSMINSMNLYQLYDEDAEKFPLEGINSYSFSDWYSVMQTNNSIKAFFFDEESNSIGPDKCDSIEKILFFDSRIVYLLFKNGTIGVVFINEPIPV